jgi:hypothetical protein
MDEIERKTRTGIKGLLGLGLETVSTVTKLSLIFVFSLHHS